MRSIEVAPDRVKDIRAVVPTGIEHYVLASGGSVHVNIRTTDDRLFMRLKDSLQPVPRAPHDSAPSQA
jgi:hypothetical protein